MPKTILDNIYNNIKESKIYRVMTEFDKHITRNLNNDNIQTRPASTNGLWCCFLLPTILLLYSIQFNVSLLYKIMTCISIGYFFYCLLFIVFMSVSCLVLKENIYGGCGAAGTVSALLLYTIYDQGFIFSSIISISSVLMFSALLRTCLTKFPKTFTLGEAMVVIQSIMLFIVALFARIWFSKIGDKSDPEMEFVMNVNLTVLSSVGIIVTALILMEDEQKTIQTLYYVTSVTGVYAIILLHGLVGIDCLISIPSYVLLNMTRLQLFILWVFLTVVTVVAVKIRLNMAVKADTVTRKIFHLLASVVFISGVLFDVHFMTLAAGCGFGALILAEALRKSDIKELTPVLQKIFKIYSDEKDSGAFAMTPIYLYVGLACPLILVPVHKGYELELLSGVLSLGVGDTAASWFGSKYGINKWNGGEKTVEGTVCNIISQILTVYVLDLFGLLQVSNAMLRVIVAAIITGAVEARTEQIDNLILPLLSIISFQITNMLGLLFV